MMSIEEILYCIGMESPTGWEYMEQLCQATGVKYPPRDIPGLRRKMEKEMGIYRDKSKYEPDPWDESHDEHMAAQQIEYDMASQ